MIPFTLFGQDDGTGMIISVVLSLIFLVISLVSFGDWSNESDKVRRVNLARQTLGLFILSVVLLFVGSWIVFIVVLLWLSYFIGNLVFRGVPSAFRTLSQFFRDVFDRSQDSE